MMMIVTHFIILLKITELLNKKKRKGGGSCFIVRMHVEIKATGLSPTAGPQQALPGLGPLGPWFSAWRAGGPRRSPESALPFSLSALSPATPVPASGHGRCWPVPLYQPLAASGRSGVHQQVQLTMVATVGPHKARRGGLRCRLKPAAGVQSDGHPEALCVCLYI